MLRPRSRRPRRPRSRPSWRCSRCSSGRRRTRPRRPPARHGDRGGELQHHLDQPGQLGDGLALAAQRDHERRQLGRGRLAAQDLLASPRPWPRRAGRRPPDQAARAGRARSVTPLTSDVGSCMRRSGHRARAAGRPPPPAAGTGRSGAAATPSARDQVASQASSGRPVSTRIGGQRTISSFSWRHRPMPPGTASPSRMARSMPPASMAVITAGWVATSTTDTGGRSLGDLATEGEPYVSPGVEPVEAYSRIVSGLGWTSLGSSPAQSAGLLARRGWCWASDRVRGARRRPSPSRFEPIQPPVLPPRLALAVQEPLDEERDQHAAPPSCRRCPT